MSAAPNKAVLHSEVMRLCACSWIDNFKILSALSKSIQTNDKSKHRIARSLMSMSRVYRRWSVQSVLLMRKFSYLKTTLMRMYCITCLCSHSLHNTTTKASLILQSLWTNAPWPDSRLFKQVFIFESDYTRRPSYNICRLGVRQRCSSVNQTECN